MDHIVILHITEPDGSKIIGIAEAGQLVRDGMNSNGIAIVNNNLQSTEDTTGIGLPTCFMRRHVLKAKKFEDACDYIRSFPRKVSGNTMICCKDGRAINFEIHPNGADELVPEEGIMTHANQFLVHPELQATGTSHRAERLRELLLEKSGELDVEYFKECMGDHKNLPQSLCRHPNDMKTPRPMRVITVATEIYDFEAGEAHFCSGPPCMGEYATYKL